MAILTFPTGLTLDFVNSSCKSKSKEEIQFNNKILRLYNSIGLRRIKEAKKHFKVNHYFYYYSKYGGKHKLILHHIVHNKGEIVLKSLSSHWSHSYDIKYCFTEQEMLEKKLVRILKGTKNKQYID